MRWFRRIRWLQLTTFVWAGRSFICFRWKFRQPLSSFMRKVFWPRLGAFYFELVNKRERKKEKESCMSWQLSWFAPGHLTRERGRTHTHTHIHTCTPELNWKRQKPHTLPRAINFWCEALKNWMEAQGKTAHSQNNTFFALVWKIKESEPGFFYMLVIWHCCGARVLHSSSLGSLKPVRFLLI